MTDNPNTTQIIPTDDRVVMALTKRPQFDPVRAREHSH